MPHACTSSHSTGIVVRVLFVSRHCCRLMGIDDSTFMSLGTQCANLQHLCVGVDTEEESIYSQEDYYCNFLTDQGLTSLVCTCTQLK